MVDASTGRHATHYKWIALSNTTLGVLMASINGTILIIALPVVFKGIQVNPLNGGQTSLLLWVLLGFNVATTVLLVTFGRLSDMFGRVKLYNLGFLIFTVGSVLCYLTWSKGLGGEIELIIFRIIQGIGGAFLFSNSAAILTDAFPGNQRGLALGLNQIAAIGGGVIGLVVGGLLAATGHWRFIFLVNVPIGVIGTIWAYVALKELALREQHPRLDIWGNVALGVGITALMLGLTYGIMPYGGHPMGWSNPWVLSGLIGGFIFLVLFVFIEQRVKEPMFHLALFKVRALHGRKPQQHPVLACPRWSAVHDHHLAAGHLAALARCVVCEYAVASRHRHLAADGRFSGRRTAQWLLVRPLSGHGCSLQAAW